MRSVYARFAQAPPAQRTAATALLVAVAYYLGANIGIILRFPPSTPSLIWPPNSILTAVLLLTAPRTWWIWLLAAFPAHLAATVGTRWPFPMLVALFVTNCSEALIGALVVRRFSDDASRLDSFRRVLAFIGGAALVGPFLSSFADAAAVAAFRGEPYWNVWESRCASNVLTELTVVPAILTSIGALRRAEPSLTSRRRIEAWLLAASLVAVAIFVFVAAPESLAFIANAPRSPLAALLPFLLWAAASFGPLGSSLSLLTTSLVALWAASHSAGPFRSVPLAEFARSLQLFLIVLAIPLMSLAAVIQERRRVEGALAERLRFEEFFARLSAAFVHLPSQAIDAAVLTWLRNLGDFLQLYRVVLLRFTEDRGRLEVAWSWAAPGFDAGPQSSTHRDWSAAGGRLLEERPFSFAQSDPGRGSNTNVTIPLVASGRVLGGLALDSVAADRNWPEELVQRLQLVAEVFANTMARKEAEEALLASELIKSAILASLSSGVAVLDRGGRIIAVNESWMRAGSEITPYAGAAVGDDYVRICRDAVKKDVPRAAEMVAGVEGVLSGTAHLHGFEYQVRSRPERWFTLSVMPLKRPEGGAVVSHIEVTERKLAEAHSERSQRELAHFTRVSTMGELTGSLAHELSQPLSGIMANAQAAARFLNFKPPMLDDARAAMEDIIADNRRAAAVVHRLRDMLKKGELKKETLDLNVLIGNVTQLLGSDAIIRGVTARLELDGSPVMVSGDRVQLEQVILNLLMNAMDAMAEITGGERVITVRSNNGSPGRVHVAVEDAGPGVRDGEIEKIFEPFYTTKRSGMGMGLSIARSIIEAHGGTIWATNNSTGGATFHFGLPKASQA